MNQRIRALLAVGSLPQPVRTDVRFPVIGTRNVTIPGFPFPLPVDVHAVAVDPCIGVPRSLV